MNIYSRSELLVFTCRVAVLGWFFLALLIIFFPLLLCGLIKSELPITLTLALFLPTVVMYITYASRLRCSSCGAFVLVQKRTVTPSGHSWSSIVFSVLRHKKFKCMYCGAEYAISTGQGVSKILAGIRAFSIWAAFFVLTNGLFGGTVIVGRLERLESDHSKLVVQKSGLEGKAENHEIKIENYIEANAIPEVMMQGLLTQERHVHSLAARTLIQSELIGSRPLQWHLMNLLYSLAAKVSFSDKKAAEIVLNRSFMGTFRGKQIYGVSEASKIYFGKEVKDLNLEEAAVLVAILRSPSIYSPETCVTKTLERANEIVNKVIDLGTLDTIAAERSPIQRLNFSVPTSDKNCANP